MLAVVGILSLSLIVTTPSNAHALSEGDTLTKAAPRIFGAVKTASPAIGRNLVNLLPGGWIMKGLPLGLLALSTSDLWMPFVTGSVGTEGGDTNEPSPIDDQWERHRIDSYQRTGNMFTIAFSYPSGPSQDWYARIGIVAKCKRASDGRIGYRAYSGNKGFGNDGSGGTFGWTFADVCPNETVVAWMLGGGQGALLPAYSPNLDTSDPQPAKMVGTVSQYDKATTNVIRGGDWSGSGATPFDPRGADIKYKGRAECIDAAGKITWAEGEMTTGDVGGVKMPSCEARGLGHGTGRTQVIMFKPDGTQQPVWDTPTAPSDPATPLCDPGKPGSGCVLEVLKDDQPCASGDVECENWASEQSKNPARWKCKFGPYFLPMASCALLEQAYRPGGAITTDANTDGDPATKDDNDLKGQPVPQPAPGPISGPTNGTAPTPGGQGQPSPSSDPESRQCFPQGWAAFNPVEWVLKPLRCAFEPSVDTSLMQRTIRDKLQMRAPVSWIIAASSIQGPGGGSCPNWTINVGPVHQNVVCGSSFTAALVGVRGPLFGLVACAMVWPLIRGIWYASIPILRVTPTGGK